MILYHGTVEARLCSIFNEGLKPRGRGVKGNWAGNVRSHRGFVYLTSWMPVYFGGQAQKSESDGRIVILRVEVKDDELYPDEDFVVQKIARGNRIRMDSLQQEVNLEDYKEMASDCLRAYGSTATRALPPERILDHRVITPDMDVWSVLGGDIVPSALSHGILGNQFKQRLELYFSQGEQAVLDSVRATQLPWTKLA